MLQERGSRKPSTVSVAALIAAFALFAVVLVFSWPDPHDRKRAIGPRLAGCCDVRIGPIVLMSRRPRATASVVGDPRPRDREAMIIPASDRLDLATAETGSTR